MITGSNIVLRLTTKDFQDAIARETDPDNRLLLECLLQHFEEEEERKLNYYIATFKYTLTIEQYKFLLEYTRTGDKEEVNE